MLSVIFCSSQPVRLVNTSVVCAGKCLVARLALSVNSQSISTHDVTINKSDVTTPRRAVTSRVKVGQSRGLQPVGHNSLFFLFTPEPVRSPALLYSMSASRSWVTHFTWTLLCAYRAKHTIETTIT
ncbi:hypothetical protein J6590_038891 [Homalodisca vitripennis]|nr:hypothetical protein J6590_038891 [Homalodisca vitripennis]